MFKLSKKGFGIVEIIIAIAIGLIFFSSIYGIIFFSDRAIHLNLRKTEAIELAKEGIEIVRIIKNNDWTNDIDTLTSGTTYYPVLSGGEWSLTTTPQALVNGIFTMTITVYDVNRDANDDIATSGTDDPNTKRVVSTISWTERAKTNTVELQSYITNFLGS